MHLKKSEAYQHNAVLKSKFITITKTIITDNNYRNTIKLQIITHFMRKKIMYLCI